MKVATSRFNFLSLRHQHILSSIRAKATGNLSNFNYKVLMWFKSCGWLLIRVLNILVTKSCQDPIVELPNGKIQGRNTFSSNGLPFCSYQEVPFAEPPVGNLRFQPPLAKGNWSGILLTQKNTKMCYQVTLNNSMETEDCLYLNVYTPEKPETTRRLPVLFFIHGGGFIQGDAKYESYGPQKFMDYDIVVVTIFYRVGPFGFLSTGDTVMPGNNGLRDQNLALKWVQTNIHLFGGDPTKVTLYGQSAGAASASYHMLSDKSKGLFRAVILSSGSSLCPWAYQRKARYYGYLMASYFSNVTNSTSSQSFKDILMATPANIIDGASNKIPETVENEQELQGRFYAPVMEPESDDAFITQKMYESFLIGNFTKIPVFMGIMSEEASTRLLNPVELLLRAQNYDNNVQYLATDDFNIPDMSTRKTAGEAILRIYTNLLLQTDLLQTVKYFSDVSFTKPVIRNAEMMADYIKVYFYQFSLSVQLVGQTVGVGIFHGGEMPFLWNYLGDISVDVILPISKQFLKLFTNFVKTVNPTPDIDPLLNNLILPPIQGQYFPYIDINLSTTIQKSPKNESFPKWKQAYQDYGVPPFDTY